MAAAVEGKINELSKTTQSQQDFIAAFTHEVKTPMTAMLGYADLMRARPDDTETQREAAGYIYHETQRLENLSRSLLALMGLDQAGALELVRDLSGAYQLYIVTNAVASVQRSRLQGSVFAALITDAFISEDAGASKPDPAYYAYVRSRIPGLTPENGLVIGDSLSTDIQGANNAGLPCCWYNPAGKARPEDLRIDYEIRDLRELLDIV